MLTHVKGHLLVKVWPYMNGANSIWSVVSGIGLLLRDALILRIWDSSLYKSIKFVDKIHENLLKGYFQNEIDGYEQHN